ncbi:MAG: hypothetical protein A2W01_01825 [Candidatus Solincola sediminis]|uniref:Uracil-DNA glycosylase-like domain-containing protein n=1 Tax=Candidatus Solincola sediminis TaxID=1797199 RepID=A0A1F2WK84_9ACTN|nr:MAG: hypothetical protein A2Y75_07500 [Candidatus Solincola sediminis]OFW58833.1 MAG: hypothetical protein A2W01_01825 [Candidatus Solincola sediminis]
MNRKGSEERTKERDLCGAISGKLACDLCDLANSISACRRCGGGRGIPGHGNIGAAVLLLSGMPGPGARVGNPWGEWRDEFINHSGAQLGWDIHDIYFSTAIRCIGRKPNLRDVRRCAPYLAEEIFTIGPQLVIASGKIAAVALRLALGDQVPEQPKAGDSFRLFSSRFLFNLDVSRIGQEEEARRIFCDVMEGTRDLLKN